jgi:hypothetical protein
MKQVIGKVFKVVLATVVATQGAWLMPAFAAGGSKRLAVKEVSAQELKLEYGAGGGGGGGEPAPPGDGGGCGSGGYSLRMTTQCSSGGTPNPFIDCSTAYSGCDRVMYEENYTPRETTVISSDEFVTRFTNQHGTTPSASYSYDDGCYTYVTGFGVQAGSGGAGGNISWEESCAVNKTLNLSIPTGKNVNIWKHQEKTTYTINRKYKWVKNGAYGGEAGTGGQNFKTTYWLYFSGAAY